MSLSEQQAKVAAFVHAHDLNIDVSLRLLDAVSELGELAKAYLKATDYGKKPLTLDDHFDDELGDVLFSLLCVANNANIDVETALDSAIQKYEARLAAKGEASSGQ